MAYKLPDNSVVSGTTWTLLGGTRVLLSRLSQAELNALGVTRISSTVPVYDPIFYALLGGTVTPRALADVKEALKAKVAAQRWEREMSGVVINGLPVATDDRTRGVLVGAYARAVKDSNYAVSNFKSGEVYVSLSNAEIIAIGELVADFIQSCFDQNQVIDAEIDALASFEEAQAYTWQWSDINGVTGIYAP